MIVIFLCLSGLLAALVFWLAWSCYRQLLEHPARLPVAVPYPPAVGRWAPALRPGAGPRTDPRPGRQPLLSGWNVSGLSPRDLQELLGWLERQPDPPYCVIEADGDRFTVRFQ